MAQFEVGGKCACLTSKTWFNQYGNPGPGPKKHQVCDIAEMEDEGEILYLGFHQFPGPRPGDHLGFDAAHFHPLESWPDLAQSAAEETVATIHEPQPA